MSSAPSGHALRALLHLSRLFCLAKKKRKRREKSCKRRSSTTHSEGDFSQKNLHKHQFPGENVRSSNVTAADRLVLSEKWVLELLSPGKPLASTKSNDEEDEFSHAAHITPLDLLVFNANVTSSLCSDLSDWFCGFLPWTRQCDCPRVSTSHPHQTNFSAMCVKSSSTSCCRHLFDFDTFWEHSRRGTASQALVSCRNESCTSSSSMSVRIWFRNRPR